MTAQDTAFRTHEGRQMAAHLALPDGDGPHPAVLVIHEMLGLNDDMRRICRRFAASGYAAFAPDLFDKPSARAICMARAVWALKTGTGEIFDDLDAARHALLAEERVDGARLGVVGFCMGGGFALLTAMQEPFRVVAPFYGDVPKDVKRIEGICPVVASFGGRDKIFSRQGRRLKNHLDQLRVAHDVKIYPEAGHSFMSHHDPSALVTLARMGPMQVGFHEASAEDAWARMLAFFEDHLRSPTKPPPGPVIQEKRRIEGE